MIRFVYNLSTKYHRSFILLLFLIFPFSNSQSEEKIIETINLLHNGLSKISKMGVNNKSFDLIHKIVIKTYDCQKMSRMVVGDFWEKTNQKEKINFIRVFGEYISSSYLKRFGDMNSFSFELKEIQEIGKNFRLVKVFLIHKKKEVQLNYLMHQIKKDWRIFDVLYDGSISEIATKKSDFNNILKDKGIKKLIQFIDKKNKF